MGFPYVHEHKLYRLEKVPAVTTILQNKRAEVKAGKHGFSLYA